jgi:hypothetical protein
LQDKRSKWKNQFNIIDGASSFHNKVREIFANDSFFKQFKCFQEVPVSSLVSSYQNNFDAVDWYIDEFNTVIELHGKQHYVQQSFGSKDSVFNQKKAFNNIKYRDNRKKVALLNANYFYIEISYKDISKINSEYLKNKIMENI